MTKSRAYVRALTAAAAVSSLSLAVPTLAQSDAAGPTGVVPLMTAAPPTGLQAPLPKPSNGLQIPDKPIVLSPALGEVLGRTATGPIDIQRAVAIAISHSRVLALAVENLQRLRGVRVQADAAFSPTLTANFVYTRLNRGQSATFGNTSITLVNVDQPVLTAQAVLPIDISGMLRAARDEAGFQEVAARIGVNTALNQTVLSVKQAFYAMLRARALVVVANETLNDDLTRLSDAQKKLKAGTVAPFDVLSAQTDVANAQQQLITARSNVSLAAANLNSVLGIAIDSPIHITSRGAVEVPPGTSTAGVSTNTVTPPVSAAPNSGSKSSIYDLLVKDARLMRPEVLGAEAALAAAHRGVYVARRSYMPSMALNAQFTYEPNAAGFSPKTTANQVSLSFSLPLWDGGVAQAEVEQAKANVDTAQTTLRQTIDQIDLDVRNAYLTLLQARDRVTVANQALSQARESYRLAMVRYTSGVSTQVEVSSAQAALTQAEQNQVNALYDYNSARSQLDGAVGRYAYNIHGVGYTHPPTPAVVGAERGMRNVQK